MLNRNKKVYVTLDTVDRLDFRTVSKRMTQGGYRMNHATARNALFDSLEIFLVSLCKNLGLKKTEEEIKLMVFSGDVHSILCDLLAKNYIEMKQQLLDVKKEE